MITASYSVAFRSWFGLSATQAEILCALYEAKGDFLSPDMLAKLAGTTKSSAKVFMGSIRQAMDTEAIDSAWGQGYRLTESGMGECRGVLWKIGEELRRVS